MRNRGNLPVRSAYDSIMFTSKYPNHLTSQLSNSTELKRAAALEAVCAMTACHRYFARYAMSTE